ncbi:beta carbonic anhydrase 5, chloroplastic isoform X6 [Vitis vinifera]|uniref:beta carbonic anhydrase 5, chloroplastic isoform X6 n=1 Tax=Vitis vinifera TaxID=29760 RepID=UPI00053F67A8|nr:beta carbonic anhydrase 5, chloroplastic isoform X6 [Vitis vinifera]|eukprot:XP_010664391.1 PREDICTED: beta carbonic anhydrase 5, chloroplastic isoform X5 [Vitis vinifera]
MHSRIRSGIRWIGSTMAALRPSSVSFDSSVSGPTNSFMGLLHKSPIFDSRKKLVRVGETHLGSLPSVKRNLVSRLEASSDSLGCGQHLMSNKMGNEMESLDKTDQGLDFFEELKHRFLCFKKQKYLEEPEHFQALAKAQSPKFMVIACADSRVCPSNILGFQPGEAFMIRNVANLVPPVENGPSETNAALEFAVNTLEVENILVIGHSSCAGIETLVRMRDDVNSSFVENWVANGKVAKLRTKAAAGHLGFYQQCKYCEKESINHSLLNLLTYPWIEDRERKGLLSIHGGYYDFLNCTFEKWTIDFKRSSIEKEGPKCLVKNRAFWC